MRELIEFRGILDPSRTADNKNATKPVDTQPDYYQTLRAAILTKMVDTEKQDTRVEGTRSNEKETEGNYYKNIREEIMKSREQQGADVHDGKKEK